LRARANDPNGRCLGSATGTVESFITGLLNLDNSIPELAAVRMEAMNRPPGNCTVQVIYGVKFNNEIMEAIDRRNAYITKPVGDILKATIEQGVRIALTAELAKKNGSQ